MTGFPKTFRKVIINAMYHFQVNLGGMLDILSNHLYKTTDVFLRELMQNGVDAITLRQKKEPNFHHGHIKIELLSNKKIIFTDNGAGLTKEEIHHFLSVIGQSSKHDLVNGQLPEDYIGRFGIGLLSCFMVSDSILIHTKSSKDQNAYEWIGLPDGTYTLEPWNDIEHKLPIGTSVILTCKPGCELYFQKETIIELVQYYGLMLPVPIYLNDIVEPLNYIPEDFTKISRGKLLSFGTWLFDEEFLDAIPIETPHLSGVAYILPYATDSSVKNGHRIYLKHMLLTDQGMPLLPDWAFFLRCFLNTSSLRPTASRESFYEDKELMLARQELSNAVKQYFQELSQDRPEVLQNIVSIHFHAIKAMSVWDDEIFQLFIDYLPFITSEGEMTGSALKRIGVASYLYDISRFHQLKPIFIAQNQLLICCGYTYDSDLIPKLATMFHLSITPLHEEDMETVLKTIPLQKQQTILNTLNILNKSLIEFDCQADIRYFQPIDLPAIYYLSDDVRFLRQMQNARENSKGIFSDALTCLLSGIEEKSISMLYLNYHNPLIQKLFSIQEEKVLKSTIIILYIQALTASGQALHYRELKAFSKELIYLLEKES